MHINFVEEKGFNFSSFKNLKDLKNLKSLASSFELTRLYMLIIASVILFLMVFYGIAQKLRLDNIQSKLTESDKEVSELKKKAEGKGLGTVKRVTKGDIFNIYESRVNWSDVVGQLTKEIPDHIVLHSIKSTKDKDFMMELSGDAGTQSAIVDMTNTLGKVKVCKSVKLQSSDSKKQDGKTTLTFNLQCVLNR